MKLKYNIAIDDGGQGTITIITDGEVTTIQHDHPNFTRISDALVRNQDPAKFLNIARQVAGIDERVLVQNGNVYFDGSPIHNALTRTILRYTNEGRETTGLVRFMERLAENPSRRGREVIFEWVQNRDLTITEDGCFIGWKGVRQGGGLDGELQSSSQGTAFVDDVEYTGHIPNRVGSIISMPRTEVMDDPNQQCSVGLHVGTYEYAKGFAPVLLEVKVAPEDVISVPSGETSWKLRCCRYEVLRIHESENDTFDKDYEPEATEEWADPGVEPLAEVVPEKWLDKLRKALKNK